MVVVALSILPCIVMLFYRRPLLLLYLWPVVTALSTIFVDANVEVDGFAQLPFMFLPMDVVYFFTIVPAPWFRHHRDNLQLRAFAAGATTAASGAIAGAVVVLGRGAISDLPTACIALTGLVLLVRFRVPEPLLVLGAGLAGLALSRVAR